MVLLGIDTVADLLCFFKNFKIANSAGKSIIACKGGKSKSELIKMAYTIHIEYRDNCSFSDNKSCSISDFDDNLKTIHLVTRRKKSHSFSPINQAYLSALTLSSCHSSNCKSLSTST